jgi:hypothetical protein
MKTIAEPARIRPEGNRSSVTAVTEARALGPNDKKPLPGWPEQRFFDLERMTGFEPATLTLAR